VERGALDVAFAELPLEDGPFTGRELVTPSSARDSASRSCQAVIAAVALLVCREQAVRPQHDLQASGLSRVASHRLPSGPTRVMHTIIRLRAVDRSGK
jgi:hypothetical protein